MRDDLHEGQHLADKKLTCRRRLQRTKVTLNQLLDPSQTALFGQMLDYILECAFIELDQLSGLGEYRP
jgi:hypothetical protein